MRRMLSIVVVGFWLLMVGLLVQRTLRPVPPGPVVTDTSGLDARDEWMNVYHGSQKIGYSHFSLAVAGDGFIFTEESLLQLTVLQNPQSVRTRMHGHAARDFSLRDVEFDLSSGAGTLQATAVVDGPGLRLTLHTGRDTTEQVLPVSEPLYLPSTLRGLLTPASFWPGHRVDAMAFDPVTFRNDRMQITVERQEPLPDGTGIQAWRVREEFHSMVTTAWMDPHGIVLREEGPMGLVLTRASAEEALRTGWTDTTALDLVAGTAVPVAHPIADARTRGSLRVRLSGIRVETVPSDDEQTRRGEELTLTKIALAQVHSYRLPYDGTEQAEHLKPTAFLQSDHPRIQATARAVVGTERDALRAAIRINDWVYTTLRKVPTVSIPNALQVLDMGEGDCNEHAVLFAALARAAGIPARTVAGAVYMDGVFLYHAWCEVWLNRWVSIDPALHQFPADVTHLKFVIGGPDEQLAMIDIIGRLGVEIIDDP